MDNSGNNRYELLFMDDDSAATNIPLKVSAEAGKKKAATPNAPQNKNKAEKENKSNVLNKNNNAQTKAATTQSGPKPVGAKNITSNGVEKPRTRNNVRFNGPTNNNFSVQELNNELPQRQFKERDGRGPPRFRNNEKFGKREFDRQSGSDKTGVKPIDKRDGAGAHNWGSAKQDIEDVKTGAAAPLTDKEDSANELSGDATTNVEEDESKQMTLDEWKALKDQRAKPNYNLRKVNEVEENAEWKKMTVLTKKKSLDNEEEFEYDPSLYPQRVGRLQRIVDIQFNFNDGRKTGFRKGGPRGPPRGGPRQEAGANNGFERPPPQKFGEPQRRAGAKPLKVDDENQFPTLA